LPCIISERILAINSVNIEFVERGFYALSTFSVYADGNVAPVGSTLKSRIMNSAVLVGWMKICP
jgi:hypothetical protein